MRLRQREQKEDHTSVEKPKNEVEDVIRDIGDFHKIAVLLVLLFGFQGTIEESAEVRAAERNTSLVKKEDGGVKRRRDR
jgi:hypothetical protein